MEIDVIEHDFPPEIDRGFTVSMVIKSFKGRKDVEVHLFRPEWDATEEKEAMWERLLGAPIEQGRTEPSGSRKVYMESFTPFERDRVVAYLAEVYADKLKSITAQPLTFPIPLGLTALSDVPEGKDIGLIRFEKIPSYTLDVPLHGLYDLSQHEPIAEAQE
ncbi:hypothetical protein [Desulfohalovibrio reitneri]|uniref:hypothetical protein n=1 Tax=Desulfohalovibrio reitneri TaxID=1307759 RepID=UPI0004A6AE2D|nr:hypothetical protein [Desulfohalovibrio reitneri]